MLLVVVTGTEATGLSWKLVSYVLLCSFLFGQVLIDSRWGFGSGCVTPFAVESQEYSTHPMFLSI